MSKDFASLVPAGFSPVLGVIGPFLWLVQLALVIHVFRTGRPYWWMWLLFSAPVIGGVAYLVIEVMPTMRSPRGFFYGLKPRKWRIADLRRELEESETVENRLALAEELFAANDIKGAHEIAVECLKGVFKDDPRTLVEVAAYTYALSDYAEALALLKRVDV